MAIIIPPFFDAKNMDRGDKPGTMYLLCDKLDEATERKYCRYKTVFTGTATYHYAPEIQRDYMWVADTARNVEFA